MILPILATFCLQINVLPFLKQFWTVFVSILSKIVRNQAPISMGFVSRGVLVPKKSNGQNVTDQE